MKNYQYIIIGGGMTGSAAVMGIRQVDKQGSIAMFSKEPFGPYNRPPLTKGLWDGKDVNDIIRPMEQYDVDLYLKTPIEKIEPRSKTVYSSEGKEYKYQKLLLATGSDPIHLPDAPDGVIYYRTREDYQTLKNLLAEKDKICVIGAGFIGSEITAALTKQDKKVTMIFPEIGISGLIFPDDLSLFLNDYYRDKGVEIKDGHLVDSITKIDSQYQIRFKDTENQNTSEDVFDIVIIGVGVKPNTQLAKDAGIETDDGILVDRNLMTNIPDIFAAGDVSDFNNVGLGKRVRVEHEDNANKMGTRAGLNMAGNMVEYDHFPFFYSDLFDLGYEAIGELNKNFKMFEDWIEPYKKGTIFYLDKGKIRGLIFWNLWGKVDQGREIIRAGKTYKESDLPGIFTED